MREVPTRISVRPVSPQNATALEPVQVTIEAGRLSLTLYLTFDQSIALHDQLRGAIKEAEVPA